MTIAEEDKLAWSAERHSPAKIIGFTLTRFIDQGVDGFKLDPAHTLDEHPTEIS